MTSSLFMLAVGSCLIVLASSEFEQKTAIELKERHDFLNPRSDNPFSTQSDAHLKTQSAKIEHDFIGGKNWAVGAYVEHQRKEMFGESWKNNEGGLQGKIYF